MIMLFALLIAVFMENKTNKDNRNTSLPFSQTDKDETSTHCRANGKGKEHHGTLSENPRTVETIQVAKVTDCECCGEDLDDTPARGG